MHTNIDQILNQIAEFYTKLYTEEPTDEQAQQKLLDMIHRHLPTDEGTGLDGELALTNVTKHSQKMPAQKSPGTDGLPAEFYIIFWDTLGRDLVDVSNFSNSQNLSAKSIRSAILPWPLQAKIVQTKTTDFSSKTGDPSPYSM